MEKAQAGETDVIIGLGGIGSGAIQGARLAGAEKIVVIEPVESKRELAFRFGATHFVTSMPEAFSRPRFSLRSSM